MDSPVVSVSMPFDATCRLLSAAAWPASPRGGGGSSVVVLRGHMMMKDNGWPTQHSRGGHAKFSDGDWLITKSSDQFSVSWWLEVDR
jgi:hypothetical protein